MLLEMDERPIIKLIIVCVLLIVVKYANSYLFTVRWTESTSILDNHKAQRQWWDTNYKPVGWQFDTLSNQPASTLPEN